MISDQALMIVVPAVTTAAVTVLVLSMNNRAMRNAKKAETDAAAAGKLAAAEARRLEKQDEEARADRLEAKADAVASVAREAARKVDAVAVKAAEAARLLATEDAKRRDEAAVVSRKIDGIAAQGKATHTLVNSGSTELKILALEGLRRELLLLLDRPSSPANDEALAIVKTRIAALETSVAAGQAAAAQVEADANETSNLKRNSP